MKVAAGRIADTFATLAGAETIVLFGSWTARYLGQAGRSPNDIDVLVIGDVDLDAMHDYAERQIWRDTERIFRSGRYWSRTSDLCRVKAALYR